MSAKPVDVDIQSLSPDAFARLVSESDDETVRVTFRAVGTRNALDRIFAIMQERYVGSGHDATVQWQITDEGEQYDYLVELSDTQCVTRAGTVGTPSTMLKTDLARFARLAAGQASGVKLLLSRKLRASGDVNLARKLQGLFDIPSV